METNVIGDGVGFAFAAIDGSVVRAMLIGAQLRAATLNLLLRAWFTVGCSGRQRGTMTCQDHDY
jgi:hypothetical protein